MFILYDSNILWYDMSSSQKVICILVLLLCIISIIAIYYHSEQKDKEIQKSYKNHF